MANSAGTSRKGEPKISTPPPQTIRRSQPESRADASNPEQKPQREQRAVQVPYLPNPADWALLQARFPMTEEEWDSMIAVLQSIKVGLVKPSGDPD